MNISLEEAISLHKCISQIESQSILEGKEYDAFDEDIVITYYNNEHSNIIIKQVRFGAVNSEKAKKLIQDFFDDVYNG